ncbi:hypothetical protein RSOLAG22IIIB_09484 [Rhizoctonia solani]|uniref:Uncharacterized protein n=1 Tax=Rhizoctonia solani TaxID=456999 RepID=A0A0K6FYH3_9AGAM|nr:hypothetical protein RSOLAG22IIIB_09484 [Rhizoctonia solani]
MLKTPQEEERVEQLVAGTSGLTSLPHLPEDIQLVVFDGQHQIAGCLELGDRNEHWWVVRLYRRSLEYSYPAEFIGMMHLANNPTLILETSEAFRLKGMYRLRKLLEEKQITQEVYRANRVRVTGTKESVMRGLNNVSADFSLLETVHNSLHNKHIAAAFSASSWKGLTTGRFYGILRWLVYKMVAQVTILQGDALECSSRPFMLSPRVTTFKHLETADKDHTWNELPGGTSAALHRLQKGPAAHEFNTPLIKAAGGSWTLGDCTVLFSKAFIPTVMGSNVITDRLEIMYTVTQHVVHIVAGKRVLEQYTSNKRAKDESDHPFSIFTLVLGRKVMNRDGIPGNGALKILVHLWSEYQALEQGLMDHDIKDSKTTLPEVYQQLADRNHAWWTLLSKFKTPKFEKGLGIEVAPSFSSNLQSPVATQPVVLLEPQADQLESEAGENGLPREGKASSSKQPVSQPTTKTSKPRQLTGHKRGRDEGLSDGEDYVYQSVGKRVTRSQTAADGSCSKDKGLDEQIHRLKVCARQMDPKEAGSVASLLSALEKLEGPVAVEVNQMLHDLMPKVVAKAQKRVRESQTYDDEDEDGSDGH